MSFAPDGQLKGFAFRDRDLTGARFVECDLTDVVVRGCEVSGLEVDAPWLRFGRPLVVNGVDIGPYVEAELNRRFPGRELQEAPDPEGLRAAWAAADAAWDAAIERAAGLPPGSQDRSVAGEWSFAQTMRHLAFATEKWFVRPVLGSEESTPFGLNHAQTDEGPPPPYADVVKAWAGRRAGLRDFLADVTPEQLDQERPSPNDPEQTETVRGCVHVVLEETWEHLRFATRDLDAIEQDAAD